MKIFRLFFLLLISVCLMTGCRKNPIIADDDVNSESAGDFLATQTENFAVIGTTEDEEIYLDLDATMALPAVDVAPNAESAEMQPEETHAVNAEVQPEETNANPPAATSPLNSTVSDIPIRETVTNTPETVPTTIVAPENNTSVPDATQSTTETAPNIGSESLPSLDENEGALDIGG